VEAGIVDHVVKSYIGNWKVKTGSKMKLFQIYELVSMWDLNSTRASPAVIAILATQKVIFSILATNFSIQYSADYLFHYLLSLNIIS
jgi:hypothetical protein